MQFHVDFKRIRIPNKGKKRTDCTTQAQVSTEVKGHIMKCWHKKGKRQMVTYGLKSKQRWHVLTNERGGDLTIRPLHRDHQSSGSTARGVTRPEHSNWVYQKPSKHSIPIPDCQTELCHRHFSSCTIITSMMQQGSVVWWRGGGNERLRKRRNEWKVQLAVTQFSAGSKEGLVSFGGNKLCQEPSSKQNRSSSYVG